MIYLHGLDKNPFRCLFQKYFILILRLFQAMVAAFSLGMGAIPWIIMSEVMHVASFLHRHSDSFPGENFS